MKDTEPGQGFLARWSERKQAARQGATLPGAPPLPDIGPPAAPGPAPEPPSEPPPEQRPLTDADMPPLDSLDGHSDYSGFLSRGVSAALRRQALTQLFHSPHLNLTDGLDDFAEDYTSFEAMGDLMTADMRHQIEVAARRLANRAEEGVDAVTADLGAGEPADARGAVPPQTDQTAAAQGSPPVVAALPDAPGEPPDPAQDEGDRT